MALRMRKAIEPLDKHQPADALSFKKSRVNNRNKIC